MLGIDNTKLGSVGGDELLSNNSKVTNSNEALSDVEYSFYVYNLEREEYLEGR